MLDNDKLQAYSTAMDASPIPFCVMSATSGVKAVLRVDYANRALAECLEIPLERLNGIEALVFSGSAMETISRIAVKGGDSVIDFGTKRTRCYGDGDGACTCVVLGSAEALPISGIDPLTGLSDVHGFSRDVKAKLEAEPEREYAILRMDVDNFKSYNEIFGMSAGDTLLKRISFYLSGVSATRVCAHIMGDHFVMLVDDDEASIAEISNAISARLRQHNGSFDFAPRFGVYSIVDRSLDVSIMCDRALVALRTIKGRYGELLARYDDAMRLNAIDEMDLISDMEPSLMAGNFKPFLQPQYSQSRGQLVGAEALIRWEHPARGLMTPGDFLPVFERNGMITRLDKYMWEQACALVRKWLDAYGFAVPISVNVSRRDLLSLDICEYILELVKKYDIKPQYLHLEITESTCMEEPELLQNVARRLRGEGFIIEMDDFGSGYSSLNTLKSMPVDVIKLDMLFLENTSSEGKGGIILNSVVNMAHWLGLPIVAEGVATARQSDYLKTLGCDCAQGYYFSRPLPVDEFEKLLVKSERGEIAKRSQHTGFFNTDEYWNPDAQATVIFNSFVGAAGIFEYSKGKLEVYRVNDHFFEELSLRRDWIKTVHRDMINSILPEDRPAIARAVREAAAAGTEKSIIVRCRHPYKGSVMWISAKCRVIASSDDRYVLFVSVANITQLRKVETLNDKQRRRIEEQTGYLDKLIDTIPCGVVQFSLTAPERPVRLVNRFALSLFGISAADRLISVSAAEALPLMLDAGNRKLLLTAMTHAAATGIEQELTHVIRKPDGATRCIRSNVCVIQSTSGDDLLQWVFSDISPARECELSRYSAGLFSLYDEVLELDLLEDRVRRISGGAAFGEAPDGASAGEYIESVFGESAALVNEMLYSGSSEPANRVLSCRAGQVSVSVATVEESLKLMCLRLAGK